MTSMNSIKWFNLFTWISWFSWFNCFNIDLIKFNRERTSGRFWTEKLNWLNSFNCARPPLQLNSWNPLNHLIDLIDFLADAMFASKAVKWFNRFTWLIDLMHSIDLISNARPDHVGPRYAIDLIDLIANAPVCD